MKKVGLAWQECLKFSYAMQEAIEKCKSVWKTNELFLLVNHQIYSKSMVKVLKVGDEFCA